MSYHLKYCSECGQPIGFTRERRKWEIGTKVKVLRAARSKNERAGLPWTPEMNVLIWRRGIVKETIMGAIVVKFEDLFSPARKNPLLVGEFKFAPDALEHCVESHDRLHSTNKRNVQRLANSKAWYEAWAKGSADRERGVYANPFKGDQFNKMVSLWKSETSYKKAKHELGETPGLRRIWVSIRKFDLANTANSWLIDVLSGAYHKSWMQMEETMRNRFLVEAMVKLLRENSLELDAKLLREIEKKNVEAFRGVTDQLLTKYGYENG
jgi:hypothetical protein